MIYFVVVFCVTLGFVIYLSFMFGEDQALVLLEKIDKKTDLILETNREIISKL